MISRLERRRPHASELGHAAAMERENDDPPTLRGDSPTPSGHLPSIAAFPATGTAAIQGGALAPALAKPGAPGLATLGAQRRTHCSQGGSTAGDQGALANHGAIADHGALADQGMAGALAEQGSMVGALADQGIMPALAATAPRAMGELAAGLEAQPVAADDNVQSSVEAPADASVEALARALLPTVPHPAIECNLPVLDMQRLLALTIFVVYLP